VCAGTLNNLHDVREEDDEDEDENKK